MHNFWIIAGNTALCFAAVVTTAVVAVYAFSRFETSQVGRQFMLTKLMLALILDYAVIMFIIHGTPPSGSSPARFFIFGIVGVIMLRWLIIIIKTQHRARTARHPVWNAPDAPPPVRREQ